MKIHVLCPLYRLHFAKTLIHYYGPENVEYYPIVTPKENIPFEEAWIHPVLVEEDKPGVICFRKFNDFIDTQPIHDDDYYVFACDETIYEPGFFDVLRNQTAKIIMCSAYRGDSIPKDGTAPHAAHSFLVKDHDDIRAGHFGLGQFIVKGEILRQVRFGIKSSCADGFFAEQLKTRFPNDIVFLTDWFVFSNYLQRGRFTKKEALLKPNWELPKYIGVE